MARNWFHMEVLGNFLKFREITFEIDTRTNRGRDWDGWVVRGSILRVFSLPC